MIFQILKRLLLNSIKTYLTPLILSLFSKVYQKLSGFTIFSKNVSITCLGLGLPFYYKLLAKNIKFENYIADTVSIELYRDNYCYTKKLAQNPSPTAYVFFTQI